MRAKHSFKPTAYAVLVMAVASYYASPVEAVEANSINTATIVASGATLDNSCVDYKITGICFWLKCTYWSCSVKTSTKVHHFIPEMVVSVYNNRKQSPWAEMRGLNRGSQGGQHHRTGKKYTQYTFKNAEAFGHPGGLVLNMISSMGYSCDSQTTAYQPYFLSALDFFAWNNGMPEMFYPEALAPGMREVKANGDLWGNLYPRSGSVTQMHDYKAAALVAQRVADIVSRDGQLHVYYPATAKSREGYWPPSEVKEGDKKTHRWQMLSPQMSKSCAIFPDGGATESYSDKLSNTENYSWALWRPYRCCKKNGQKFLGSVDWIQ